MPLPDTINSIDDLLTLPDDGLRHELLDGEHVVTPAPGIDHQRVVGRLYLSLSHMLTSRTDVEVFTGPADIYLSETTLLQPDVLVVSRDEQLPAREWREVNTPLLAVEVLSPSTAASDRGQKRRLYLEAGVGEYWIVDIDARLIERWSPENSRPEILDRELKWKLSVGASGRIDVVDLFLNL